MDSVVKLNVLLEGLRAIQPSERNTPGRLLTSVNRAYGAAGLPLFSDAVQARACYHSVLICAEVPSARGQMLRRMQDGSF